MCIQRRASEESSPLLGLSIPGEKDTATALPHGHRTADTTALNPRTLHLHHAQGESASPGTSAPFSISTICSPQNLQTNQGGENSQPHSISVSSSSTLHFICMHGENAAVASSYNVDRTHKILGQEKRQGERHETSPSAFRGLVSGGLSISSGKDAWGFHSFIFITLTGSGADKRWSAPTTFVVGLLCVFVCFVLFPGFCWLFF